MMKIVEYFVPLVLLAFAAVLLGQSWREARHSLDLIDTTVATQGEIVRMKPYLGGRLGKSSALVYFPVVKFRTDTGREVVFEHRQTRRADHYRPGDPVVVRYRPDQPEEAVIAGFSNLWALPLLYALGGGLLVIFGGWFLKRAMGGREAG